jgi:hypothetical protein
MFIFREEAAKLLGEGSISQYMEKVIQRIEAEDVRWSDMTKEFEKREEIYSSVDPDPDWILTHLGSIRIRICNTDPDLGGQKLPTKIGKS